MPAKRGFAKNTQVVVQAKAADSNTRTTRSQAAANSKNSTPSLASADPPPPAVSTTPAVVTDPQAVVTDPQAAATNEVPVIPTLPAETPAPVIDANLLQVHENNICSHLTQNGKFRLYAASSFNDPQYEIFKDAVEEDTTLVYIFKDWTKHSEKELLHTVITCLQQSLRANLKEMTESKKAYDEAINKKEEERMFHLERYTKLTDPDGRKALMDANDDLKAQVEAYKGELVKAKQNIQELEEQLLPANYIRGLRARSQSCGRSVASGRSRRHSFFTASAGSTQELDEIQPAQVDEVRDTILEDLKRQLEEANKELEQIRKDNDEACNAIDHCFHTASFQKLVRDADGNIVLNKQGAPEGVDVACTLLSEKVKLAVDKLTTFFIDQHTKISWLIEYCGKTENFLKELAEMDFCSASVSDHNVTFTKGKPFECDIAAVSAEERLDTRIKHILNVLDTHNQGVFAASQEFQALGNEMVKMDAEIEGLTKENDSLKLGNTDAQVKALMVQFEEARSNVNTLNNQLHDIRKERDEYQKNAEKWSEQCDQHLQTLLGNGLERDTLKKKLARAQDDLKAKTDELAKAVGKSKETDDLLSQAKADLAQAQGDLSKAQANLSKAEGDLAQAKADLSKAEADLSKAQADLSKAEGDLTQAKADWDKCKTALSSTQTMLNDANKDLEQKKSNLTTLEKEVEKRGGEIKTLQANLDEIKSKFASGATRVDPENIRLEVENVQLKEQLADKDKVIAARDKTIQERCVEINTLTTGRNNLQTELRQKTELLDEVKADREQQQKRANDKEHDLHLRIQALQSEIDELKKRPAAATDHSTCDAEKKRLEGELDTAQKYATKVVQDYNKMETDLQARIRELQAAAAAVSPAVVSPAVVSPAVDHYGPGKNVENYVPIRFWEDLCGRIRRFENEYGVYITIPKLSKEGHTGLDLTQFVTRKQFDQLLDTYKKHIDYYKGNAINYHLKPL